MKNKVSIILFYHYCSLFYYYFYYYFFYYFTIVLFRTIILLLLLLLFPIIADTIYYLSIILIFFVTGANLVRTCHHQYWTCAPLSGWLLYSKTWTVCASKGRVWRTQCNRGVFFNTIMHIICPIILIISTVYSGFRWTQNVVAQVQLDSQSFHVSHATKGAAGRL